MFPQLPMHVHCTYCSFCHAIFSSWNDQYLNKNSVNYLNLNNKWNRSRLTCDRFYMDCCFSVSVADGSASGLDFCETGQTEMEKWMRICVCACKWKSNCILFNHTRCWMMPVNAVVCIYAWTSHSDSLRFFVLKRLNTHSEMSES